MKYLVDPGLCCGHAQCEAVAPDVYKCDEDGINVNIGQETEVEAGKEDAAKEGAYACPESAIQVYD